MPSRQRNPQKTAQKPDPHAVLKEIVGKRLFDLRTEKGVFRSAVAAETGIHEMTIYKVEKGRQLPDTLHLMIFADYYECSVEYILCRTNKR